MSPDQIELRFSAQNLANKDFLSLSDPFLVWHAVVNGRPSERIGRTETVKDDLNPVWTTTFSFARTNANTSSTLLIDVFDRDSTSDDKLTRHDFLGRTLLRLDELLLSPYKTIRLKLVPTTMLPMEPSSSMSLKTLPDTTESSGLLGLAKTFSTLSTEEDDDEYIPHPAAPDLRKATTSTRAMKGVKGSLTIYAETLSTKRGSPIVFRVMSALLKDTSPLRRKVTQFYELQRERRVGDRSEWNCVYRSRDGVNVNRNNYVVFDEVSLTEQQVHNMQPSRKLRLAFYRRRHRVQHELISYCTTSMVELLATRYDERKAIIAMEGRYGDETGLGNVIVAKAERLTPETHDHAGGLDENREIHIHLRADHFINDRYVSSLNDAPKYVRRVRQLPTFVTLH